MVVDVDFTWQLPDILPGLTSGTYYQKLANTAAGVTYATGVVVTGVRQLPADKSGLVIQHDTQLVFFSARLAGKGEGGTELVPKREDQFWLSDSEGYVLKEIEHPPLTDRYRCKAVRAVGERPA
jgi:hypothetical protein